MQHRQGSSRSTALEGSTIGGPGAVDAVSSQPAAARPARRLHVDVTSLDIQRIVIMRSNQLFRLHSRKVPDTNYSFT